jgi:hypothetical protein
MCFSKVYDGDKKLRSSVAIEDIQCFKVINEDCSPLYGGIKKNPKMTHKVTTPYVVNIQAPLVKLKPTYSLGSTYNFKDEPASYLNIDKGYHSFKELKKATRAQEIHVGNQQESYPPGLIRGSLIKTFIIPKGTKYFENDEEYVSETITMIN